MIHGNDTGNIFKSIPMTLKGSESSCKEIVLNKPLERNKSIPPEKIEEEAVKTTIDDFYLI